MSLYLLYLFSGLVVGALVSWLFSKYFHAAKIAVAQEKNKQLQNQLDTQLSEFQKLQKQSQETFENLAKKKQINFPSKIKTKSRKY